MYEVKQVLSALASAEKNVTSAGAYLKDAENQMYKVEKHLADAAYGVGRSRNRAGSALSGGFSALESECKDIRSAISKQQGQNVTDDNKSAAQTAIQGLSARMQEVSAIIDAITQNLR